MLAVILTILGILIFTKWIQSKPFFWRGKGIQYSTAWPIVGSMGVALTKPIYEVWPDLYYKSGKGPVFGMHFFCKPALLITDPEVVKKVTVKDAEYFQAHASIEADRTYDPLGESVFFVEGGEWKEARTKMSPYFTPFRIKAMLPIFKPIAETFIKHMVQGKGPININVPCMKLSVETLMSGIFGLRANTFEGANSQFYGILEETRRMTFILRGTLAHVSKTLYRLLGLTVFSKEATEILKNFSNDVLNQRLQGNGNRPDFMEGMTELYRKEMEKSSENNIMQFNQDGTRVAKFDRYSIAGHCMMMFGAGTETTGNTLTFLLYELALNPEIQEKARNEIKLMLEKTNSNFNIEDMYQMKYVFMILKETLRKYPVFTAYGRKCTKKYRLNDLEIPVGTLIMLPVIALHHDPKYFPEPQIFIPERFQDEKKIISGTYIPFGIGPRTCIGMRFSETEIVLALIKLLPKHRLLVCSKTEIPVQFSNMFILSPKNGIWLNVEEIN